jgi:hypothetical protein
MGSGLNGAADSFGTAETIFFAPPGQYMFSAHPRDLSI